MNIIRIIRKIVFLILGPVVIAGISVWVWLQGGRFVTTDNAYLKADITSISPEISGKVIESYPSDNERVEKGQVLFRLVRIPHEIALARAKATLANIRRDIDSQKVAYNALQVDIERAEIDVVFQERELKRAKQQLERKTISDAQYDASLLAYQQSQNTLKQKQSDLVVARAKLIDPDMPSEGHPLYQQAMAEFEKAELELSYTEIKSPVDGIAVNVSALVGENVIMGTPLLNIIDDSHLWIEANYKETDLTYMQTGQPVEITVDSFPGQTWRGTVASITPATGAEFSLLPAQNSSGNWVKVVQRIAVRIEFTDPIDVSRLSAGMSAEVTIDTAHERTLPWAN
jgi:membrane fusion protein (multidrug efflux system)